jgi:hypothetical protein
MSRMGRFFRALGRILLVMAGFFLVGVALLYSQGAVSVYVHEKQPGGHTIWVPVPALAVTQGIRFVPQKDLGNGTRELRPYLPAIRIATEELARCPDTRFVEVQDADDHVVISKQGNLLLIDVDSSDATVHVSFPIDLVPAVAEQLNNQLGEPQGTI